MGKSFFMSKVNKKVNQIKNSNVWTKKKLLTSQLIQSNDPNPPSKQAQDKKYPPANEKNNSEEKINFGMDATVYKSELDQQAILKLNTEVDLLVSKINANESIDYNSCKPSVLMGL